MLLICRALVAESAAASKPLLGLVIFCHSAPIMPNILLAGVPKLQPGQYSQVGSRPPGWARSAQNLRDADLVSRLEGHLWFVQHIRIAPQGR